jgi:nucleoside-diphosphate-sugar epimerase
MCQVLIAGCGYVGTALGNLLVSEGHTVWGLRRRSHLLPPQIRPIKADLSQPETLHSLPSPLDYLFYTAAAEKTDDVSYQATYIEAMTNMTRALDKQGIHPRRAFFPSSTAVYAQKNEEWIDENSPAESSHFTGSRLLQAERLLLASQFPWTVVRLSGIYGPNRTRLIKQARQGELSTTLASSYTNRIHQADCAGVLHHLMVLESPQGLYIGSDHEPARLRDIVEWLAQQLKGHPRNEAVPLSLSENRFRSNKRCRNLRLVDSGYRFRYPTYREGYAALIEQGAID